MEAFLIFIVLPLILIGLSFWIKPLVKRDEQPGDPMGAGMAAQGMFGGHGLEPDPQSVPEETDAVKFDFRQLDRDVKERK